MYRVQLVLRRLCAGALIATMAGCASPPAPTPSDDGLAQSLGIAVHGVHLSAHGSLIDLRYRVLDPTKAVTLLEPKRKVQLLDPRHQAALGVPESPIIGPMRQTARNHVVYQDRDYFVLFVNPGHAVGAGDTVLLALDGKPLAQLKVE